MSDKYFAKRINLREGEVLIAVLHRHSITYAKQTLVTAILILGSFFFMFLLFSLGTVGVALFSALLATGVIYGCREFFIWYANAYVVTSQRLVNMDQQGIFHRSASELDLNSISEISYAVRGFTQTIFHIGNVKIKNSGKILILKNIKAPGKVNQLLADLIKDATGRQIAVNKEANKLNSQENSAGSDINQKNPAEYEDYKLDELLAESKETLGEMRLKKLLVEELNRAEAKPQAKLQSNDDDLKGNFKQKRLSE